MRGVVGCWTQKVPSETAAGTLYIAVAAAPVIGMARDGPLAGLTRRRSARSPSVFGATVRSSVAGGIAEAAPRVGAGCGVSRVADVSEVGAPVLEIATCWTSCEAVRTSPSRIAGGVAVSVRAGSPAQRRVSATVGPPTSGAARVRSVVNIPAAVGLQATVMTAGAAVVTAKVGDGVTVNGGTRLGC